MTTIRFVLNIYERNRPPIVATRTVCRHAIPRIDEHFVYLSGWGAARVTTVFHGADSEEVECHVTIPNLQAELASLLEQLRANNWEVRE